jgi:hypothetical protein
MTADLAAVTFTINVENQFTFTKAQSLSKSKEGEDGEVGPAGPQGPQGPTGDDGIRTATGLVFYQLGSSTTPSTPSASYFNFSSGGFVGLTSNWATTTPDMEAGTSTNRYYSSYYVATETSAGSGVGSVTFQTPIRAFSFNQVVTFSSLSTSGSTIINGDNITTGIIKSDDYVSLSGSVFSSAGMAIDLDALSIETPSFAIDSDGDGFFSSGNIKIGGTDAFGNYTSTITLTALANATDTAYSSLGTIEFTREDINDTVNTPRLQRLAADMEVVSFLKNELQTTVYKRQSPYSATNRLIIGEDRFFLGDPNNALIRTETISSLDYMVFNADRYQLRGTMPTTAAAANLYMNIFSNNQLSRSTSSLKYKTDVEDYDKGIDAIKSLRPVYYKGKEDGDKRYAGLIAEEVHEAGLDEFVMYDLEGEPDALAYQNMVSLLIKGMQEQQEQIELLKSEIENLKSKL